VVTNERSRLTNKIILREKANLSCEKLNQEKVIFIVNSILGFVFKNCSTQKYGIQDEKIEV